MTANMYEHSLPVVITHGHLRTSEVSESFVSSCDCERPRSMFNCDSCIMSGYKCKSQRSTISHKILSASLIPTDLVQMSLVLIPMDLVQMGFVLISMDVDEKATWTQNILGYEAI